ncbi:MAG: hypothetical protein JW841_15420 [Deltaproteobacteria bacterium]|nr:hypothetical protein [Deltaproteobacteria bacterium]
MAIFYSPFLPLVGVLEVSFFNSYYLWFILFCNGTADEGCECTPMQEHSCYAGTSGRDIGECHSGTKYCVDGHWSTTCANEVLPQPENCTDGKDNDCDGLTDQYDTSDCPQQIQQIEPGNNDQPSADANDDLPITEDSPITEVSPATEASPNQEHSPTMVTSSYSCNSSNSGKSMPGLLWMLLAMLIAFFKRHKFYQRKNLGM